MSLVTKSLRVQQMCNTYLEYTFNYEGLLA